MTEQGQSLRDRIQDQTLQSVRDYYGDTLGGLMDQLPEEARGEVQGISDMVGQSARQVQDAAEQAAGRARGPVTNVLESGSGLLSETTNDQGQTVQRTLDDAGNIVSSTLDEADNIVDESDEGSLSQDNGQQQGSGASGRITVKDVTSAASQ